MNCLWFVRNREELLIGSEDPGDGPWSRDQEQTNTDLL